MHQLLLLVFLSPLVYADTVYVENKPQVRVTTALVNFDARIMDQWGNGGGRLWTISNDSHHPFIDRQFGGATRRQIRGTNIFGSGYPYGVWNTTSIANRSFPFGAWPLYWGDSFMESGEVSPQLDAIRPGGHISIVPLRTTRENFTVSQNEVYYAVGDSQSLLSILVSYVTWCHVSLAWPKRFDPTSSNATIKLENVLVYYRASSFALASPTYSNPNSRNASYQPTEDWIPDTIKSSSFWQCLDSTTSSALPIMNRPPRGPDRKSIFKFLSGFWWILAPGAWVVLVFIGWIIWIIRDWIWNFEENWEMLPGRIEVGIKKAKEAFPCVTALKQWRREKEIAIIARREARETELAYEEFP